MPDTIEYDTVTFTKLLHDIAENCSNGGILTIIRTECKCCSEVISRFPEIKMHKDTAISLAIISCKKSKHSCLVLNDGRGEPPIMIPKSGYVYPTIEPKLTVTLTMICIDCIMNCNEGNCRL